MAHPSTHADLRRRSANHPSMRAQLADQAFPITMSTDASGALRRMPTWGPARMRRPLGHVDALDGLRALSVAGVIAYHLDAGWASGGFLGVEVFFVVSGFLITTLLLGERRTTHDIDVRTFWARRFRRLLPAVVTMIVAVCAFGVVFHRGDVAGFRGDAVSGLLYVENWWAVFSHQPYFQVFGRPSPLAHLWSLAIEEQFYLVWPIVAGAAIRRFGPRRAMALTIGAAVGSAIWMAALSDVTAPDRAYLGTDTRAFGLLFGAAAAFVMRPSQDGSRRAVPQVGRFAVVDLAALFALPVLLWQFAVRSEYAAHAFPWAFLAVDALAVVVIVASVTPGSIVSGLLGSRVLAAVGRRSYSLYVWHWPVVAFTQPGDLDLRGAPLALFRLTLSALLAEVSYRFVEHRFRMNGRRPLRLRARRRPGSGGRLVWSVAGIGLVAVALGVATAPAARPPATPELSLHAPVADPPLRPLNEHTGLTSEQLTTPVAPIPPATVVGESVTLGAAPALAAAIPGVSVEARVGRSFEDGVRRVEALGEDGTLGAVVVVHLGDNGPAPAGALDRIAAAVGPHRKLVLVTVRVPRRWSEQVNGTIRAFAVAHRNVGLVDWEAVTAAEPGLTVKDGVHLSPAGIPRYTSLLAEAVRGS